MLALLLPAGGYAGVLFATNNFHVVVPDEVYRSAQPSAGDIAAYSKQYGIKTIINLRGANPKRSWYKDEIAASAQAGIVHIDFGMSASEIQPSDKLQKLMAVLETAPKPILIHCQSGADRTGLVAAVYLAGIAKQSEEAAEAQLSIRFGHFSIPVLSRAYSMDESFERVEGMFGFAVKGPAVEIQKAS